MVRIVEVVAGGGTTCTYHARPSVATDLLTGSDMGPFVEELALRSALSVRWLKELDEIA